MKKEIVHTDKYALIISDDEIKEGDYRLNIQRNTIHFVDEEPSYFNKRNDVFKKVIAHLPLSDAPILEGVPLLPPLRQGDDVKELAEEEYYEQSKSFEDSIVDPIFDTSRFLVVGFKEGYNKAKEKYKYTEEDLKLAMNWLFETKGRKGFEDLIERLNQPSRPTHFECEMEDYGHYEMGVDDFVKYGEKPKTTTNSQGQVELVGKYLNL